jgi:hypothetical protein
MAIDGPGRIGWTLLIIILLLALAGGIFVFLKG